MHNSSPGCLSIWKASAFTKYTLTQFCLKYQVPGLCGFSQTSSNLHEVCYQNQRKQAFRFHSVSLGFPMGDLFTSQLISNCGQISVGQFFSRIVFWLALLLNTKKANFSSRAKEKWSVRCLHYTLYFKKIFYILLLYRQVFETDKRRFMLIRLNHDFYKLFRLLLDMVYK